MLSRQDSIQVSLPREFVPFLGQYKEGENTDEKVALSLAVGMFLSRQITMAKAAELARLDIWEFANALKSQGIPWGEYSEEALRWDELTMSKLAGEI